MVVGIGSPPSCKCSEGFDALPLLQAQAEVHQRQERWACMAAACVVQGARELHRQAGWQGGSYPYSAWQCCHATGIVAPPTNCRDCATRTIVVADYNHKSGCPTQNDCCDVNAPLPSLNERVGNSSRALNASPAHRPGRPVANQHQLVQWRCIMCGRLLVTAIQTRLCPHARPGVHSISPAEEAPVVSTRQASSDHICS
jgi:hypothetical protein